jgi:phytoene dehydrogenase-like protein
MDPRIDAPTDIVVVGGGLAGLVAAATAARAGVGRVLLFDPHPLGGRARVDDRNGYRFGRGPRALYLGGPAERVLQGLGVDTTSGGPPSLDGAGALDGGQVHRLPQGPLSALRSTLMTPLEKFAFAKAFARLPRIEPATLAGTTVSAWLDHEGLAGAPRRLIEALIRVATYCDAPDLLDAGAALAAAQAGLSPGVRYLDGGWQSLVDATWSTAQAAGVAWRRDTVQLVTTDPDRPDEVRVCTSAGELEARSVVLATGLPEATIGLLGGAPPSWPLLGPPITAACLELGLLQPPPRRFVLGIDEPTYLSTHAPPADLAPPGHAVVHAMRYQRPGVASAAAEDRQVLDHLVAQAGIESRHIVTERFLATMVVSGAMPVAAAGGLAGRVPIEVVEHPGVFLAGDWVGPTGMLLDAAASSAAEAARRATRPAPARVGT